MTEQEKDQEQGGGETENPRGDFVMLIAQFRDGRQNAQLTKELDKAARAVIATGKKAKQTIVIELAEDDEEAGRIAVSITSKLALPEMPRTEYLYARKNGKNAGELVRDNPETDAMMSRGLFSGDQGDNA